MLGARGGVSNAPSPLGDHEPSEILAPDALGVFTSEVRAPSTGTASSGRVALSRTVMKHVKRGIHVKRECVKSSLVREEEGGTATPIEIVV